MKTFVVLAVSIVLVSILFCPMVMAAPPMPDDLQMVQPDPSLSKGLSAFFGKWEGTGMIPLFLIVEKIDEEKASLYVWRNITNEIPGNPIWARYEAKVIKDRGIYKLRYQSRFSNTDLTLKGIALDCKGSGHPLEPDTRLRRVP